MALVKRLVKGSALTYAEGDGNLTYLDNKVTGSVDSFPVFDTVNTVTTSNITKFGSMITIDGGLTVTGDLTAMQYIISSSVTHFTESFSSGSTNFGDTLNDTHQFTGSVSVTGSLTVTGRSVFSGSATGLVNSLSITSNTASLDLTRGNFFTLQLVGGADTYINPTNIQSGQTVSILLSTVGSGTVSFPTNVLQQSGSAYVPTTTTGKDIITLVTFDTSNLYLANVKNLI